MAKLFIVGFPKNIGEIELVELFSLHGAVNTVTIVTNKGRPDFIVADRCEVHHEIDLP